MLRDQELLEMERPVSARHAPMRRCDRAAQFCAVRRAERLR